MAGVEGQVRLSGVISSAGAVCSLRVVSVDPPGWGFEAAALEAVEQWRYEPALRDGQPVAVFFAFSVGFQLQ